MTKDQIALVQNSFRELLPLKSQPARVFYEHLFELDPALRPMFAQADMPAQGRKLMAALGFVVGALRTPGALREPLRELAIRHCGYGVTERHYATVGRALLETLRDQLPEWTPALWAAWAEAYGIVSTTMIEAAREREAVSATA